MKCCFCFEEREEKDLEMRTLKIRNTKIADGKIVNNIIEIKQYFCKDKDCFDSAKLTEG